MERKMTEQELIASLDEEKIQRQNKKISNTGNNINQMAVRINFTGNIYAEDLQESTEKFRNYGDYKYQFYQNYSINQFSTTLTEVKLETTSLLLASADNCG
ncbi:MAG: plasmid mobilization relaxosome protein MobC [Ruminococcus sp.]|nr:plasmid mobilization relaxosome protein MobC [Ruminococcus sp.]